MLIIFAGIKYICDRQKDHPQRGHHPLKLLRWNEYQAEPFVLVRYHSLCQAKTGKQFVSVYSSRT